MKSGIYKITNIITNQFYIGSAVILERRRNTHFYSLIRNDHDNSKLQNAFNKYGEENFVFEILEEIEDKTKLIEREQYYLDTLKPHYNICKIAGSTLGRKVTIKHKRNLSKAWERRKIEKPHSIETREKMSKSISEARKKPEVIKRYQEALSKRKLIKCPHCDYTSKNIGSLKSVHFDNCLKNPNLDIKALLEKKRLIKLKIKAIKNSNKLNINS